VRVGALAPVVKIVGDPARRAARSPTSHLPDCAADSKQIAASHADIFTLTRLKFSAMKFASFRTQA
jgi:hypothetical protein